MDKSIWAHWYNLPGGQKGGNDHLEWLHGSFMPKILGNRGVLWAAHYKVDQKPIAHRITRTQDPAVGVGNDYILLFGGESTHAFSRDALSFARGTTDRWTAQFSDEDKKMLAQRTDVRVSIMTEEVRVQGPECGKREGLRMPAPCIQLGSYNGPTAEIEEELLAWYADYRMASLSKMPGCVAMRKMVGVVGWNKHGVMYEFLSLEARRAAVASVPVLYPEMEAWTNISVPKLVHAFGSPHVAERIFALEK
ncbi:MAG: hypothetical protein ABL891_21425 [Burkholderiales bacterium]